MSREDLTIPLTDPLPERAAALDAIDRVMEGVARGRGGVVALRGPAGIGKSALADVAGGTAERIGIQVRHHRADVTTSREPWHAARELLHGWSAAPTPTASTLEDATRRLADAAAGEPIAIVIDDLQWVDVPSLRWIHFLARRIDAHPVALLVTMRPGVRSADVFDICALGTTVDLEALSSFGIERVVVRRLGKVPLSFVSACHEMSGGNPFLLHALLDTLEDRGLPATSEGLGAVHQQPPVQVLDAVAAALGHVSAPARAVAETIAVRGNGATEDELVALLGRRREEVNEALHELRTSGLITEAGVAFTQPLEAVAALRRLDSERLRDLHARFALVRHDEGADETAVARHLEHTPAGSAPWAGDTLRLAGERSASAGDHQTATRWLRRALDEPLDTATYGRTLELLAASELAIGDPGGVDRLRAAHRATDDPNTRLRLATALVAHGRIDEAIDELEALVGSEDVAMRRRAELTLITTLRHSLAHRRRSRALVAELTESIDLDVERDPRLLAEIAYEHALAGTSRALVAQLALRGAALLEGERRPQTVHHTLFLALVWSGEFGAAKGLLDAGDDAGSLRSAQRHRRGTLAMAVGAIDEALAHSLEAVEGIRFDAPVLLPGAMAQLARCQIRTRRLGDAAATIDSILRAGVDRQLVTFHPVLLAQAELELALGNWSSALAAAQACRSFSERMGTQNPLVVPSEVVEAEALLALGAAPDAAAVALDALERMARYGWAPEEVRAPLERVREFAERSRRAVLTVSDERPSSADAARVLRLLGEETLTTPDGSVPLGGGLPDVALRLLAVHHGSMHRDELAEILWPEGDTARTRARLRRVLSELRREHGAVLNVSGDLLSLDSTLVVDAREFHAAALEAAHAPDSDTALAAGLRALEWYRGDLCPGQQYHHWIGARRDSLRRQFVAVGMRVAELEHDRGDTETAVQTLESVMDAEPWDERAPLLAAQWLLDTGRAGRARTMLSAARAIGEQLGLPPSSEIEQLEAELNR